MGGKAERSMINKGAVHMKVSTERNHEMVEHPSPGKPVRMRLCVLAVMLGIVSGYAPLVHALDPMPAHVASAMQSGVVTSIEQRSLFISGKMYTVDPELQIRDQEDNVLQPEVVKIGHEVKFHLKKGESNKIDFLVVYMPQ